MPGMCPAGRPEGVCSIVVPMGASGFGARAMPTAAHLARATRSTLDIVLVEGPSDAREVDRASTRARRLADEWGAPRVTVRGTSADEFARRAVGPGALVCLATDAPALRWIAEDVLRLHGRGVLVGPQVIGEPPAGPVLAFLTADGDDRSVLDSAHRWSRSLHRPALAACATSDGRAGPAPDRPWSNVERLGGSDVVRALLGFERRAPATMILTARPVGWSARLRRKTRTVARLVATSPAPVLVVAAGRSARRDQAIEAS
jgi:hypothetical protein